MGGALFRLGHAPLTDDALDVYYAADIEQQVDVRELVLASGPTPGSAKGEELDLSELGASVDARYWTQNLNVFRR